MCPTYIRGLAPAPLPKAPGGTWAAEVFSIEGASSTAGPSAPCLHASCTSLTTNLLQRCLTTEWLRTTKRGNKHLQLVMGGRPHEGLTVNFHALHRQNADTSARLSARSVPDQCPFSARSVPDQCPMVFLDRNAFPGFQKRSASSPFFPFLTKRDSVGKNHRALIGH